MCVYVLSTAAGTGGINIMEQVSIIILILYKAGYNVL